jgi:hypothetical protein
MFKKIKKNRCEKKDFGKKIEYGGKENLVWRERKWVEGFRAS